MSNMAAYGDARPGLLCALDQVASRQHGLVSATQLYGLGLSGARLHNWVLTGRLVPVRRGVYRLNGAPVTWHGAVMAAVMAAGDLAVASHTTAAELWRMRDRREAPDDSQAQARLHLIAPRRVRIPGVIGHQQVLRQAEIASVAGVPTTTPERTLLDLAGMLSPRELGELTDEAIRRRLVNLERLRRTVESHAGGGRRRLGPIQKVLSERVPGFDPGANAWEARMDQMWEHLGLPPAVRQYRLRIGRRIYRPDRAILDLKIAVDWNGYQPHGALEAFHRDSDRRADLAAAGWFPLDFTARSSPERICRTVLAVVAQRRLSQK